MAYVDGFLVPVPEGKKDAYFAMARDMAPKFRAAGATSVFECWGDGLEHGHTTDFYRAVKAEEGENVVFSWLVWPDKATRDAGWAKLMADMGDPPADMPFDGKRMFWGGFTPEIIDGEA